MDGIIGLAARRAAFQALNRVDENGAYIQPALSEVLSAARLSPLDKRLATEISYGVMTYRLTLDWIIRRLSSRPALSLDLPVRQALRIGLYQIFYLERIPAAAAVHTTVELVKNTKKRPLASFVNGVMRGALRQKDTMRWPTRDEGEQEYLSILYSHPYWLVDRWLRRYGFDETEKLLAANNKKASLSVRVNTLRISREELRQKLREEGVEAAVSKVVPDGLLIKYSGRLSDLRSHRLGYMQSQGESAMLCAHILAPQPGEQVLDACSAPGGKTAHMAQLMENQGSILALDIYPHRLKTVDAHCRRMGVSIVETLCLDAREAGVSELGLFDRILLDAPCSGFGVIRRRPDIKWRRREDDIYSLADTQRRLLQSAVKLLKSGGTLLYSTCTNEPEETDVVVARVLEQESPRLAVSDLRPYLPGEWHSHMGEYGIHLYTHLHDVDGFYITRLVRK